MTYQTDSKTGHRGTKADFRPSAPADKNLRIGIIGAGVSGLVSAHTLKKLGYNNITIFEKEREVGGKVKTLFHEGRAYELGAVWLTADYKTVLRLAREFKVPKERARSVSFVRSDGALINMSKLSRNMGGIRQSARAAVSFMKTLHRFPECAQQGFVGVNPVLHDSIEEFSEKFRFLPFTQILAPIMTSCGYGFYQEIPALYWMKMMPMINNIYLRGLIPFRQTFWKFPGGFQHLWTKVAADLPVKLSTEVTHIERSAATGRTVVTAAGMDHEFDRIIMTTPLRADSGVMTLSAEEQDLFGRVVNLRYCITLAKTDSRIHGGVIDHASIDKVNHVNFIGQFKEEDNVSVFYQMLDEKISDDEALQFLKRDLTRSGIKVEKVVTQKTWNYFPHVRKADLDNGFYRLLDSLQGRLNTYYAGGLLSFETVEHTASYAEYLMKRFFGLPKGEFR